MSVLLKDSSGAGLTLYVESNRTYLRSTEFFQRHQNPFLKKEKKYLTLEVQTKSFSKRGPARLRVLC